MKKSSIIRRLVCFCLMLSLIVAAFSAVPVSATGTTEVVFGEVMGKVGDEVTIPVTIKNNPGIAAFRFRVTYNSDDLTFISAQNGDILSDGLMNHEIDSEKSTMTFLWFLGNGSIAADGEIAKLKFKISDKAKGDYPLKVTYLAEDLLDENRNPVAYTVTDGKISTGSTVSGSITSFGDTAAVTVRLLESEKELNIIQTTNGTYSFGSVSPGNYTVEVSKLNHVTRKYTVTVEREDITQDVKIHLIGDVTGDGYIKIGDYAKILAHVKKTTILTGYDFECADVTGDGDVKIGDYAKVLAHVKRTSSLW